MLDLGFLPDIERILRQIPDERQAMLFSATMPDPIITLARTFMNQPTHIRAEAPHSAATHDTTEQFAYRAHALDKVELVTRVLQANGRGATMIFTRTKRTAQKVVRRTRRARLQGRRRARRPRPGRPREGAQGVPHRRRRRAGRHRRRRPRHRHRRHHPRHQLPDPRGRPGLRAPHRPHRPRGQDRHRGHARRLGRAAALDDDRQGARPEHPDPAETYSSSPHSTKNWTSRPTPRAPSANRARRRPSARQRRSPPDRPARNRTRNRRRTRGGEAAAGHPEATTEQSAPAEGDATADGADRHAGPRRRRRRPRKSAAANAG